MEPSTPTAGVPRGTWIILAGLTIVGLALRLPLLSDSLFGDELSTNFVVNGFGVDSVIGLVGSDQEGTPPLFFLLTWLAKGVGEPVAGVRWISLLAGLAAIPLTYVLGLLTVGRRAAVVGAAIMALSPFLIFYSTEARAYALVMVLVLIAAVAVLMAVREGGVLWWVVYAGAAAAAAYSHYTCVFALLGLFAWSFFAHRDSRRALLIATAGAVVLYLPWLGEFAEDSGEPASKIIEALHPLTLATAKTDLVHWSVAHPMEAAGVVPGNLALWLIGFGAALGAVGVVLRLRGGELAWRPSSGLVLVLVLALVTPVGAALHNLVADSVFIPRNFAASSPGLALAIAALATGGGGRLRVVAVALLLAGFAIGAVKILDEDHQRPDYAAAAEFIEAGGNPGAPVIEVAAPTPGPQTALEAELAEPGEAAPRDRTVHVVGFAPMDERLDARGSGAPGILDPLPAPTGAEVAIAAVREAGSGRIFVVAPGAADERSLRVPGSPTADFMAALPDRFRQIEARTFPGYSIFPVTVHVFESRP